MQSTNKDKSIHGQNAILALETLLKAYTSRKMIDGYEKNYRRSKENYITKQFLAHFLIRFNNGDKWIIYSTTSLRSDRLKGNQWDSYNLKSIDKSIKKSILIYPDSVEKQSIKEFK